MSQVEKGSAPTGLSAKRVSFTHSEQSVRQAAEKAFRRGDPAAPKDGSRQGAASDAASEEADLQDVAGSVFPSELAAIMARRRNNGRDPATGAALAGTGQTEGERAASPAPEDDPTPIGRHVSPTTAYGLVGIGLSGGGQRSATFCLGVLQGLYSVLPKRRVDASGAKPSDLGSIDYISSVSGGGYINASLVLGLSENGGRFPFGLVSNDAGETETTRHLRDNSRYLVEGGILSFIVVYLRGVIASFACVLPFVLAGSILLLLMVSEPHELARPRWWFPSNYRDEAFPVTFPWATGFAAAFLFIYAIVVSRIRVQPVLSDRVGFAAGFAILALLFIGIVVIEAHLAVLKLLYVPADAASGTQGPSWIKSVIDQLMAASPLLTAGIALLAPFAKTLGEAARKEVTSGYPGLIRKIASQAVLLVSAAIVPLLLWLLLIALTVWGTVAARQDLCAATCAPGLLKLLFVGAESLPHYSRNVALEVYALIAGALFLLSWRFIDVNANSLHQVYRDRLAKAYLASSTALELEDAEERARALDKDDRFPLSNVKTDVAPYPLFNTALNVPGSAWANQRGRNAEFFLYSPQFIGSALTGYVATRDAEMLVPTMTLGTAMAISGAAAAPNMGMASMAPMSPTLALLNIRLGRWARNPVSMANAARDANGKLKPQRKGPGARWLLREAFSKTGLGLQKERNAFATAHKDAFIFLTDGGHIENLGVYELLRRRCRLIICVDAEHDPALEGASLAQLERFARIDLGTRLRIDISGIAAKHRSVCAAMLDPTTPLPPNDERSGPHAALGLIDYPAATEGGAREIGALVYVKPSLSGDENNYLAAYKRRHLDFPQESTADQFFTEEQFEGYRALGEHIMRRLLNGSDTIYAPETLLSPDQKAELLKLVNTHLPGAKVR